MALIGYARINSTDRNVTEQTGEFCKLGINTDNIFIDICRGSESSRPKLSEMKNTVRSGDILIIPEYSRLARNVRDFLTIINELSSKGVLIRSLKENLDTSTQEGRLILSAFEKLSEFDHEMILQKQYEGVLAAKAEGKYRGRQPIPFDENKFRTECEKWQRNEQTATQAMKNMNMKPNRFYRLVKKMNLGKKSSTGVTENGLS